MTLGPGTGVVHHRKYSVCQIFVHHVLLSVRMRQHYAGLTQEKLLEELNKRKNVEIDPHTGKIFAYVYTSKDPRFETVQKAFDLFQWDSHTESSDEEGATAQESKSAIVKMFFHAFMHENALNPLVFPSLRQFEVETVAMVANMLNGDGNCVGSVTSGGTESLLMAVKTYRDRARSLFPSIKHPEIVSIIAYNLTNM